LEDTAVVVVEKLSQGFHPTYLSSFHPVIPPRSFDASRQRKMLDQPGIFTYRDAVAVIQLIPFTVYLGFGFVLCWRHGFRRSEGWVILVTFSTLRVLAACFQLASINYPTDSVYGGALICQGIGLAPLTLLNIGLFVRVLVCLLLGGTASRTGKANV
jgi:hypothetical protein